MNNKTIRNTILIFILGIVLGVFSKFLDTVPSNELPIVFEILDIRNFLGRFSFWTLMGLYVSIYSSSYRRASVNVFVFFVGMVTSYYAYSYFIAGFFPVSYALIWVVFTLISPILAIVCYYAKGNNTFSLLLSSMILAVLFNMTFVYGIFYFEMRSILELIVFICGFVALKRQTIKESVLMLMISLVFAVLTRNILLF